LPIGCSKLCVRNLRVRMAPRPGGESYDMG